MIMYIPPKYKLTPLRNQNTKNNNKIHFAYIIPFYVKRNENTKYLKFSNEKKIKSWLQEIPFSAFLNLLLTYLNMSKYVQYL